LPFRSTTVVVGRNNAGKSTVVEALRLVSVVLARHLSLGFKEPNWGELPRAEVGVEPSVKNMEINFETLFYQYGDPPAIIDAKFANQASLTVYVGPERLHAVIRDSNGRPARTRGAAAALGLPRVAILPQVAPLARREVILSSDYVRTSVSSSLAPLHFRNQLNVFADLFPQFQELADETWPGLQVQELEGGDGLPGDPLALPIRNEDFVADVALLGHGVQMWLQTVWFLVRSAGADTAILDEPDVYMHPDLQRRLIRLVRRLFPQVVVATHSIEILAEVEPGEVLVIDRRRRRSAFLSALPGVQEIIDQIGSVHNVHLARLGQSRRCLLVEGEDCKILSILYNTLFQDSPLALTDIPSLSIGGWGGFAYALGAARLLASQAGDRVVTYCLLDSDYHAEKEKRQRLNEAKKAGLQLHIWEGKEVENYLLVPSAIARAVRQRLSADVQVISEEDLNAQLEITFADLKNEVFDALASELLPLDRSLGLTGANRVARERLERAWTSLEGRLRTVPGKEVISRLSTYTQQRAGVGISPIAVARAMLPNEIDAELAEVLSAIRSGEEFP
jgi:energy-coupling factor transporter ATP-binding protein EcfA2